MSPFQHGEVFVTEDVQETDLDLGHYERFTHAKLRRRITTDHRTHLRNDLGKGTPRDYLGKTVQVIPHVTDEIKAIIKKVSEDVDVVIVEIGGYVGDIESLPFLEAIRQMRLELGAEKYALRSRHAGSLYRRGRRAENQADTALCKEMLGIGIQPDILLCRSDRHIPPNLRKSCAVLQRRESCVISMEDVTRFTAVPAELARERLGQTDFAFVAPGRSSAKSKPWIDLVQRMHHPPAKRASPSSANTCNWKMPTKVCRSAASRRTPPQSPKRSLIGSNPKKLNRRKSPQNACTAMTGFSCRRIRQTRHSGMVHTIQYARKTKFPSSEFASACSVPPSNTLAMSQTSPTRTAPNSISKRRIALFINCANCSAWTKWAARCASVPGPANSNPVPSRTRRTENGNQRTPPSSLRIQPRVRKAAGGRRSKNHRPALRTKITSNREAPNIPGSSVASPSRIQIQAA